MSSIASSSSSSSASDSSSEDDMSCDDNTSNSSSDHSLNGNERYVSNMTTDQKFGNSLGFSTTSNPINSNIYDFNSNNESMISDHLMTSALSHQKSSVSSITGPLLFSTGSLISTPELNLSSIKNSKPKPNSSSQKSPRKRCNLSFNLFSFFRVIPIGSK